MFRHEYKASLKKCEFTDKQTGALLQLVEDHFPRGRDMLTGGWVDGMNSICRFLYGDMLSHDEFEDDHPFYSSTEQRTGNWHNELKNACLASLDKYAHLLSPLRPSALSLVTAIRQELNDEQATNFLEAMLSLAAPRMYCLLDACKEDIDSRSDGYILAKGAWWCYFLSAWDQTFTDKRDY
ncbi:hypothetical protein ACK32R_23700 [Aeromonas dhakensis]|uniref:hypothetical protein n=1 Tax=Aeromonas dhakensis TaxID=196024 RepID=UPI003985BA59